MLLQQSLRSGVAPGAHRRVCRILRPRQTLARVASIELPNQRRTDERGFVLNEVWTTQGLPMGTIMGCRQDISFVASEPFARISFLASGA